MENLNIVDNKYSFIEYKTSCYLFKIENLIQNQELNEEGILKFIEKIYSEVFAVSYIEKNNEKVLKLIEDLNKISLKIKNKKSLKNKILSFFKKQNNEDSSVEELEALINHKKQEAFIISEKNSSHLFFAEAILQDLSNKVSSVYPGNFLTIQLLSKIQDFIEIKKSLSQKNIDFCDNLKNF